MNNMINAVIFDLDGVIVDSEPVHQAIEKKLFHELKINVSKSFHQTLVGMNEENLWRKVLTAYGIDADLSDIVKRKRTYLRTYLQKPYLFKPVTGVIPLIRKLNSMGIELALASSSPKFYIDFILHNLGIDGLFGVVVSGEEVIHSKPAPDIFLEAAMRLRKKPELCLVIEDSTNGIKAAKSAGMTALGFGTIQGHQDLSDADFHLEHFDDFDLKEYGL